MAELATLEEPIELLHIAAETMIVSDDDLPARLFRGSENPLDAARGKR